MEELNIVKYSKEYYLNEKKFIPETWYPLVKNTTFKSYFLRLEEQEIRAIINYYKVAVLKRDDVYIKSQTNEKTQRKIAIDKNDTNILLNLELKIKTLLKSHHIPKFFIRLSTRSPKDGTPYSSSLVKEGLKEISKESNLENKLKLLFRYQERSLCCSSTHEVLSLLLTSERVFSDCLMYSKMKENIGENIFDMSIIIREWQSGVSSENEYRCFVYKNRITAISQYNHYIVIDELKSIEWVNSLKSGIFNFWLENMFTRLFKIENYVFDIVIINKSEELIGTNDPGQKKLLDIQRINSVESKFNNIDLNKSELKTQVKMIILQEIYLQTILYLRKNRLR